MNPCGNTLKEGEGHDVQKAQPERRHHTAADQVDDTAIAVQQSAQRRKPGTEEQKAKGEAQNKGEYAPDLGLPPL